MIEITHDASYPQPTEAVFAALTDFAAYPAWQTDVESAFLASGVPAQAGSRVHQVRKIMGRRTDIDLTVAEFVPGQLLTLRTEEAARPSVRQTYRLMPAANGCTLTFLLVIDGVPRMAEHLARTQLSRQVPQMLDRVGAAFSTT